MSQDQACPSESSASFRRLLSSHHSIYNTLTDPLLECASPPYSPSFSPHSSSVQLSISPAKEEAELPDQTSHQENKRSLQRVGSRAPMSPLLDESLASFSSWQSIHLPSFRDTTKSTRISSPFAFGQSRPASASILSNSSDEDGHLESLVLVPSFSKQVSPKVLLFETDEEDEADDDAGASVAIMPKKSFMEHGGYGTSSSYSQRRTSVRTDSSQTFIMPKMSLSDELGNPQLIIVSSKNVAKNEVDGLIDFLHNIPTPTTIRFSISHVLLEMSPLEDIVSVAQSSDLLIILNDGCKWISDLTDSIMGTRTEDASLPTLVVVNLLSFNYFAALFDIIRCLKPSQNIKCSNLRDKQFLNKVKEITLTKLGNYRLDNKISAGFNQDEEYMYSYGMDNHLHLSGSRYAPEKPNYKSLGRNICQELTVTSESYIVDPLCLSPGLTRLAYLTDSLRRHVAGYDSDGSIANFADAHRETLWILCSFSIGIGVGFTLDTMNAFEAMKRTLFLEISPPLQPQVKPASTELIVEMIGKGVSEVRGRVVPLFGTLLTEVINVGSAFEVWGESALGKIAQGCKHLSQAAFDSAMDGFVKITSVLRIWIE